MSSHLSDPDLLDLISQIKWEGCKPENICERFKMIVDWFAEQANSGTNQEAPFNARELYIAVISKLVSTPQPKDSTSKKSKRKKSKSYSMLTLGRQQLQPAIEAILIDYIVKKAADAGNVIAETYPKVDGTEFEMYTLTDTTLLLDLYTVAGGNLLVHLMWLGRQIFGNPLWDALLADAQELVENLRQKEDQEIYDTWERITLAWGSGKDDTPLWVHKG